MRENRLAKVVSPLHCNSWKLAFHQIKVASMFIHFGTFMAAVYSCKVPTSNRYVIVSSSGMPCWKNMKNTTTLKNAEDPSVIGLSLIPLTLRLGVKFQAKKVYFWWVTFGAQISDPTGGFRHYHFITTKAVKSPHRGKQICQVVLTSWIFMDFYGFSWIFKGLLWIFMDFYGFLRIFMDFYGFWGISMD